MTEIRRPSEVDLARITDDRTALIDRLLEVVELEIVPLTQAPRIFLVPLSHTICP